MSTAEPLSPIYTAACQFGMRGLRLVPVEFHTRTAILPQWERNASNSVEFIDRYWANGRNNLALCCGPQPAGWNILLVDVDVQSGGRETLDALEAEYGKIDRSTLCFHRTPSGGIHMFFDVPPGMAVTGTDVLGPGIDCRGGHEGHIGCGYGVLPPSEAPSKSAETMGELLPYGAGPGQGLLDRDPGPAPQWMLNKLAEYLHPPEREVQASIDRHPSAGRIHSADDDPTPGDWVRANLRFEDYLVKHGWTQKGQNWARPGKTPREGTGAQLHDDGRLAIWTPTDVPPAVWALGKRQVDGGVSISLFDFIAAYEFGGDRAEFGRYVRREWMTDVPRGTLPAERLITPPVGLNLPPEFWTARPWLTHTRDSAWAMGSTPDSQLIVNLARVATMIHPSVYIPAIVRATGSFDLITVAVAVTGGGKSSLMRRAEELLPSQYAKLRFGLGLGSGEGIVESYYRPVEGGKRGERERFFEGVNFVVDEGALLTGLATRQGYNGIERLLTAWSGGTLSTANAEASRFRHVQAGTYRFTMVLAIQVDLANGLWAGNLTAQGFTGRLLFAMSRGGDVPPPGRRPADPGPWPMHLPHVVSGGRAMGYPAEVIDEVQWNDFAKQSDDFVHQPWDAHRDLQRLKLAGILAWADGRMDTNVEDWGLATQIVDVSSNVRTWLHDQAKRRKVNEDDQADTTKGRRQAAVEDAQHAAKVRRVAKGMLKHITKDGLLLSELRQKVAYRDREAYADDALASLVEAGLVQVDETRVWI